MRLPMSIDATQPLCKAPWRNLSHRGAQFDSAFYPGVATSYRIMEQTTQLFTLPSHQHTYHSVTSIPGSTSRTPPALSLQRGWSLRLRRNACRPAILTPCVQLWDHSWYTCEHLRTATFTHACFHTHHFLHANERRRNAASLQSRVAQSDCITPRHQNHPLPRGLPPFTSITRLLSL